MPRPTKAFRRQKVNAALAYKRGDRKEAYALWKKASDGLKEFQAKKRGGKNKPAESAAEGEAAAESTETASAE